MTISLPRESEKAVSEVPIISLFRGTDAGVRNRRRIRTKASLSLVFLSIAIRRTGMFGCRIPIASGNRDGFACAKTNNSRRLRVSPRKASCSKVTGKAWDYVEWKCWKRWTLSSSLRRSISQKSLSTTGDLRISLPRMGLHANDGWGGHVLLQENSHSWNAAVTPTHQPWAHTSWTPLYLQKLGDETPTEKPTGKHSVVLGTVDIKDAFLMVDQEKPMAVSLHNRLYRVKKNVAGQRLGAKMWYWSFRQFLNEHLEKHWCIEQPCIAKNSHCCVMVHVDVMFCGDGWYWENVFLKNLREHYNISHSQLEGIESEITFLKRKIKRLESGLCLIPLRETLEKPDHKQLPVTPQSKQKMSVKKLVNVMPTLFVLW